ncbi:MAG: hypothetical protein Q9195_006042 [Heterodermia aff. obscurata]
MPGYNSIKSIGLLCWIVFILTSDREIAAQATSISDIPRTPGYSPSVEKPRRRLPIFSSKPLNLSAHDSVECFENRSRRLGGAGAEDCRVVVNHVILGYPNPMGAKTFGWNDGRFDDEFPCLMIKPRGPGEVIERKFLGHQIQLIIVDIDLRRDRNQRWYYGSCMIFVRNPDHDQVDTFSMVDIALTVNRIVDECIKGTKYGFGGSAGVGSPVKRFFVAVGGVPLDIDATA